MKKILLLSLFSLFILVSCKDNTTSPVVQNVIWPLAVDNYWEIKMINYDSLGNVASSLIDTTKVVSDSMCTSGKIYKLKFFNDSNVHYNDEYACNKSDGFYMVNKIQDSILAIMLYKYPCLQGEQYYLDSTFVKIESTNESVNVSAGVFNCYKYVIEINNGFFWGKSISYMSPGVGQILFEYYIGPNVNNYKINMRQELLSYKLY